MFCVICKEEVSEWRYPEIRTPPKSKIKHFCFAALFWVNTVCAIIAPKETSFDLPIMCFYTRNFCSLGTSSRRESHPGQNSFSTSLPCNPQVKLQISYYLNVSILLLWLFQNVEPRKLVLVQYVSPVEYSPDLSTARHLGPVRNLSPDTEIRVCKKFIEKFASAYDLLLEPLPS